MLNSEIPSAPHCRCRCAEHLSRISNLEGRLSLLKRQAKTFVDQDEKSFDLMKWVSLLENQVSDLMAKIIHLTSRNAILSLLELLNRHASSCNVSFLAALLVFCYAPLILYANKFYPPGSCFNPVYEDRQVSERIAALGRASTDTNTFWIDPRHRSAIILLQDRA
jgi:hypothetical protein